MNCEQRARLIFTRPERDSYFYLDAIWWRRKTLTSAFGVVILVFKTRVATDGQMDDCSPRSFTLSYSPVMNYFSVRTVYPALTRNESVVEKETFMLV